jgi:hypothetical protein
MSKHSKIYLINHNGDSSELKESLNEAFNPFLDTEEGGYMREYIDMVAEEEELDLGYRSDFDMAFDSALAKLKGDQPELDFEAIKANKESFFKFNAVDANGKIIPQTVDYSKLTPILVKAIQEQDIKIKEQEESIKKLNNDNRALEQRIIILEKLIKSYTNKN